jgi:hypothetical protein
VRASEEGQEDQLFYYSSSKRGGDGRNGGHNEGQAT